MSSSSPIRRKNINRLDRGRRRKKEEREERRGTRKRKKEEEASRKALEETKTDARAKNNLVCQSLFLFSSFELKPPSLRAGREVSSRNSSDGSFPEKN